MTSHILADLNERDYQRRNDWRRHAFAVLDPLWPAGDVDDAEVRRLAAQVIHLVDQVEALKSAVVDAEEAAAHVLAERAHEWQDRVDELASERDAYWIDGWCPGSGAAPAAWGETRGDRAAFGAGMIASTPNAERFDP